MRRKILIGVLALGTVLGYGAFFARMACHARGGPGYAGWGAGWRGGDRQAMFERHVAELCSDAALRSRARDSVTPGVVVIPNLAVPAAVPPPPAPPPAP